MVNTNNEFDTDIDGEEAANIDTAKLNKKKLMIFLLPALIVIAIVGFYYKSRNDKENSKPTHYSIVEHTNEDSSSSYTILYDLPEVEVRIQNNIGQAQILRLKLNIELSTMESIPVIDSLTAKLSDAIISHIISLTTEELSGSEGLYWLRKELLYRLNLISSPIKITNLNFKNIEIIKG